MKKFHSGFVALIGRPNVGKSTLMKILNGVYRKDSCENSGKRQPRGSCKGIRKDDGRRKNPHNRGDGGKIEDTDGKSGAGRKDR